MGVFITLFIFLVVVFYTLNGLGLFRGKCAKLDSSFDKAFENKTTY